MFAIENLRKTFVAPGNVVVNAVDDISLGIAAALIAGGGLIAAKDMMGKKS